LTRMAKLIGDNVHRLRRRRGWTQDELAVKVGVSRSAIGEIERGAVDPAHSTVQALADVFEISVDELTGSPTEAAGLTRSALQIARLYDSLEDENRELVKRLLQQLAPKHPSSE
jgi:transcriptional regulator with XRE-family HTH domain